METPWKCAGCGSESAKIERTCDCITDVLFRGDGANREHCIKSGRDPKTCKHEQFASHVRVGRLTDAEGGPVTGYTSEIHIECAECKLRFRFIGQKFGSSPFEPMLSADGLELRAPLEPAHVTEICGQPLVSGAA